MCKWVWSKQVKWVTTKTEWMYATLESAHECLPRWGKWMWKPTSWTQRQLMEAIMTMPHPAIHSGPQISFHTCSPPFCLNTPMLIAFPVCIPFGEIHWPPDTQSIASNISHWYSGRVAEVRFSPVLWGICLNREPEPNSRKRMCRSANQTCRTGFKLGSNWTESTIFHTCPEW